MKVLAFNGSPRKNWNTAILLQKTLEGAKSKGAETELVHLYDLNYKGCVSCFACKLRGGKSYGKCVIKDDLTPLLKKIDNADAIILGSPIYFGNVTGEMRSFMERMAYPYLVYDENYSSLFKKKIPVGLVYTMNVKEDLMHQMGYDSTLKLSEMVMARTFGMAESLFVYDTYQFSDYSKYEVTAFGPQEKAKRREEQFPQDCQKAFDMGVKFATSL